MRFSNSCFFHVLMGPRSQFYPGKYFQFSAISQRYSRIFIYVLSKPHPGKCSPSAYHTPESAHFPGYGICGNSSYHTPESQLSLSTYHIPGKVCSLFGIWNMESDKFPVIFGKVFQTPVKHVKKIFINKMIMVGQFFPSLLRNYFKIIGLS